MSNTRIPSNNSAASRNPELPPGPVPAPAPRQAVGIPAPPLSTAEAEDTAAAHHGTPYQIVTNRIVALLEAGVVPWKASWIRPAYQGLQSLVSRKPHRGINRVLLGIVAQMQGYKSPYWLTYRQASELGGHVRKGEKGCPCFFWKLYDGDKTAEGDTAADNGADSDKKRFVARYYTVFSLDQCEGIEAPPAPDPPLPSDDRARGIHERSRQLRPRLDLVVCGPHCLPVFFAGDQLIVGRGRMPPSCLVEPVDTHGEAAR